MLAADDDDLTPLLLPEARRGKAIIYSDPNDENMYAGKHTKSKSHRVDQSKVDGIIDKIRQGAHCSLFCGGVKCKHESWEYYKASSSRSARSAIEGLNSSWVGQDVIASQRPSTSLFLKHLLIQQFKAKQVTGVFNLQEKGEHANCGPDGIYASSGYSYNGEEDLMRHSINYYEFPWPDMTTPEQDIVLRSVQVMDYHVKNSGKVLVHCHAGLGRTGLMIACYLVYSQRIPSAEAISLVRRTRPGAIQTVKQGQFVYDFERHLWRLTQAFRVEISDALIDVDLYIQRQRQVLHGNEAELYRWIPRPIHRLLCRLINLTYHSRANAQTVMHSLAPSASPDEGTLGGCRLSINRGRFNEKAMDDVRILSFLVCDWFRSMSSPAIRVVECDAIVEYKRSAQDETTPADEFAEKLLNKCTLHTIGIALSAFYIISSNLSPSVRAYGFRCLTESLTHAFNPIKVRHSPVERELINGFFVDWADSIGEMYYSIDLSKARKNTDVLKIAVASQLTLNDTARDEWWAKAITFHPADLITDNDSEESSR